VKSNYKTGITLEYTYASKYLPVWRQIDAGLKTLFGRFEQAAISGQRGIAVDSLIGTTIPATSSDRPGSLAGWHEKGGRTLSHSELGLSLSEYYRDGQAIFIITRIDGNLNQTILDVKLLPANLIDYKIVGNKLVFLNDALNRYSLEPYCKSKKSPNQ
jgi:hypothetical protein